MRCVHCASWVYTRTRVCLEERLAEAKLNEKKYPLNSMQQTKRKTSTELSKWNQLTPIKQAKDKETGARRGEAMCKEMSRRRRSSEENSIK